MRSCGDFLIRVRYIVLSRAFAPLFLCRLEDVRLGAVDALSIMKVRKRGSIETVRYVFLPAMLVRPSLPDMRDGD